MRIVGIIPARYGSTRFPGKVLADLSGKPMIQRVWERSLKAKLLDEVYIATDDRKVGERVEEFGGKAMMTPKNLNSGTDRVAWTARKIRADLIVNIQGDEPLIAPQLIDRTVVPLIKDKNIVMATAGKKIEKKEDLTNPNVVKVVLDRAGFALYFSRAAIPYPRNSETAGPVYKHIGIYVYRRNFLLKIPLLRPSILEKTEMLEQLRVLENGYQIKVVITPYDSLAVDVPEDIKKVERVISLSVGE